MFDRRQAPARLLAATIVGAALFAAVPADAQNAHGVIAFGETPEGKGVAYGFSWNFHGKDEAHAEAVNACISSGGTDCIQLAWFRNGCGALAIDQYGNAQESPECRSSRRKREPCGRARQPGKAVATSSVRYAPLRRRAGHLVGKRKRPAGERFANDAHGAGGRIADSRRTRPGPAESHRSGVRCRPRRWRFRAAHAVRDLEWQAANGLEATGHVTPEQFAPLAAVDASPTEEQEPELQRETADARNYDACMEHCTKEGRDFDHCHPICSDSTEAKPSAAVPAAEHSTATKTPTAVPGCHARQLHHYRRENGCH